MRLESDPSSRRLLRPMFPSTLVADEIGMVVIAHCRSHIHLQAETATGSQSRR